jgi:hypothetical protein
MIKQVLLHPEDYAQLVKEHDYEHKLYMAYLRAYPYTCAPFSVTLLGEEQNMLRSFVLDGVTYVECRIKINGEYLIGKQ